MEGSRPEAGEAGPVLLYDGVCALCNVSVRFVLRHDRRGTLKFAPLQSPYARAVLARHPAIESVDSMIVVETAVDGREALSVRSAAALRIAAYLGGFWRIFLAAQWLPPALLDFLYDAVARRRYRLFGRHDQCPLPPPEARHRFI